MPLCPVCSVPALEPGPAGGHWACPSCTCWFRPSLPDVRPGQVLDLGLQRAHRPRLRELGCRVRTRPESGGPFDLITLVDGFQHRPDPLETLGRLRALLAEGGRVFLRLPDHQVAGFRPGAAPFAHSLESLLELLVQGRDLFKVAGTRAADGLGWRDVVLRPLERRPSIHAFLIVKNEERDLPRCLRSIEAVVDGVVVLDTGSTDRTLEVAVATIARPVLADTYLGASAQDASGDWKLWDFAKARNQCLERLERIPGADYALWMDADDELLTPAKLRRLVYLEDFTVFGVMVEGPPSWVHHRLWKTGQGIRFRGPVHEYPDFRDLPCMVFEDVVIRHDAAPGAGEDSNRRNLRILLAEHAEQPSPRSAFYLANTHRDGQRWLEAVPFYAERIRMGPHYRDEWLFAHLFKARCEKAGGQCGCAERTLLEALGREPDWAEFWMELGWLAFDQGRWAEAMGHALQACAKVPSPSHLWRERGAYTDQPPRLISLCLERLGDLPGALAWARRAQEALAGPDPGWEARAAGLARATGAGRTWARPPRIALIRPGSIGDILMTLNLLPALREAHPGHVIHYFCAPWLGEQLGSLMEMAGASAWKPVEDLPAMIQDYDLAFNLVGYPLQEGYPERPMARHLIQYFAEELGLDSSAIPALDLTLPTLPGPVRPYATLHPVAGWSAYKNWPLERWQAVVAACPHIPVYQIGAEGDPRVPGTRPDYMGRPLMESVALMAGARMHLGVDSFTNHLTHFRLNGRQVPGLILWGSTQPSASGYAENTNLCLGLACQPCFREDPALSRTPRGACIDPPGQTYGEPRHACMAGIGVERVLAEARRIWETVIDMN